MRKFSSTQTNGTLSVDAVRACNPESFAAFCFPFSFLFPFLFLSPLFPFSLDLIGPSEMGQNSMEQVQGIRGIGLFPFFPPFFLPHPFFLRTWKLIR